MQQKTNLEKDVKRLKRKIKNLKLEHTSNIAKVEKRFDSYIEIRQGRKSDLKHDLTDCSTIINHKGKRYIRINHGKKQMQPYIYIQEDQVKVTNIEPPLNVYVDLDEILNRKPFNINTIDTAKKDYSKEKNNYFHKQR